WIRYHFFAARIPITKANPRGEKCDLNQRASIDRRFNFLIFQTPSRFNVAKLMRAMVLDKPQQPLQLRDVEKPRPAKGELLVRIATCAVCRTDLHVADGELPDPKLPLIPGHQIVGHVEEIGEDVNSKFQVGDRVGIPWLGWTDGECAFCRSNRENLCDQARFTGYTIDGGYAEFTVADAR